MTWGRALAVLGASAIVAGCGAEPRQPPPGAASPQPGSIIIGISGNDFAAPVFQEIGSRLQGSGITLNYQLDGRSSTARSAGVVAGESTSPLTSLPYTHVYVPIGFGGVAVIYNLPGFHHPVQLRGKTLADIFLGRVRDWNDREIRASNPGTTLPAMPITVVHRSDPATATDVLTQFLAANSNRWSKAIGSGETVGWVAGTPENSDTSLLTTVADSPGSIAYTDLATALQDGLATAHLRNPSGQYVAPTLATVGAVGGAPHPPGDLSLQTLDARVHGAYPLSDEAYVLVARDPCIAGLSHPQTAGVQRLLTYIVGAGQAVVRELSFAPLSAGLRASAQAEIARLQCGGQAV